MENQTNPPPRIGPRAPQHFYIPSYEDQESFYSYNFQQRTLLLVIPDLECLDRHFLLLHYFHQDYNMDLKDRFFISFRIVSALCYAFRQGVSGVTSCLRNYLRNLGYKFDQTKSKRRKNGKDPYYFFRLSDQEATIKRNKRLDNRKKRRLEKIQGLKKDQQSKTKTKNRKYSKKRSTETKKRIKIKKIKLVGSKTPNQQNLLNNKSRNFDDNSKKKKPKKKKKIVVVKNRLILQNKPALETIQNIDKEKVISKKPEKERKRINLSPTIQDLKNQPKKIKINHQQKNLIMNSKQNIFLNKNNYYDDLSYVNNLSFSSSSTDDDLPNEEINNENDSNVNNNPPSNNINPNISNNSKSDIIANNVYNNINYSQSNSIQIESNQSNNFFNNSTSFSRSNYSIYKEFVPSSLINKSITNQTSENNYLKRLSSFVSNQNMGSFDEKVVEFSSTDII
ncbi:hypothetical protein M0812_17606 [Anaeramoeba flamelloides]|uniref:HSF-type DNA-binding domain-containing protein n=1 Tax=Anaeramoeba flamelloides TaxID=1746091 RepID=A0AAV7Z9A4_9EUKA|nr:hypothetical protein M0812_17606 [Anaeramoeba flamelloides]